MILCQKHNWGGQAGEACPGCVKEGTHEEFTCIRINQRLKEEIGKHRYDMWFESSAVLSFENDCLDVLVPNRFIADWIERHFYKYLAMAARVESASSQVKIRIDSEAFESRRLPSEGEPLPKRKSREGCKG